VKPLKKTIFAGSCAAFVLFFSQGLEAAEYIVKMKSDLDAERFFFEPSHLKIKLGDTVRWVQADPDAEHNVVSYPDRIPAVSNTFESPMLSDMGDAWSMTFEKEGTYGYHCHPHEEFGMSGEIIVGRPSRPDELRKARPGEHEHQHKGHGDDGGKPDEGHGKHKGHEMHEGHEKHKGHGKHKGHEMHEGHEKHKDHGKHKGHEMNEGHGKHKDHEKHKGHEMHKDHGKHKGHEMHEGHEKHKGHEMNEGTHN
jgi:plastocyanin